MTKDKMNPIERIGLITSSMSLVFLLGVVWTPFIFDVARINSYDTAIPVLLIFLVGGLFISFLGSVIGKTFEAIMHPTPSNSPVKFRRAP